MTNVDPIVAVFDRESMPGATSDPETVRAHIERTLSKIEPPELAEGVVRPPNARYDNHTPEERAEFIELMNEMYPG